MWWLHLCSLTYSILSSQGNLKLLLLFISPLAITIRFQGSKYHANLTRPSWYNQHVQCCLCLLIQKQYWHQMFRFHRPNRASHNEPAICSWSFLVFLDVSKFAIIARFWSSFYRNQVSLPTIMWWGPNWIYTRDRELCRQNNGSGNERILREIFFFFKQNYLHRTS